MEPEQVEPKLFETVSPGPGAEIIFFFLIFTSVSLEDARTKKNLHWDMGSYVTNVIVQF